MKHSILSAILVVSWTLSCAQRGNISQLGWDLSYSSVLDANAVGPNEWIRKWFGPDYQSPANAWIAAWNHEPIESSILLEFPAHAGERIIMWFARTKTSAYYHQRGEGNPLHKDNKPPLEVSQSLDVQAYDKFFSEVSNWKQQKPLSLEEAPNGAIRGYNGVMSLYNGADSRQILLTSGDFAICETKACDKLKRGRLLEALRLIPSLTGESRP